jgi:Rieske 2Fe-2S family protein
MSNKQSDTKPDIRPDTNSIDSSGMLESTLPSSWYLNEEIYNLEREHIFMCEWVCALRAEQIPNPGDHKVLDVYGESILLVRNERGELRGFYNVCRHRGASMCHQDYK